MLLKKTEIKRADRITNKEILDRFGEKLKICCCFFIKITKMQGISPLPTYFSPDELTRPMSPLTNRLV